MTLPARPSGALIALFLLRWALPVQADVPLPAHMLDPQSAVQAWNVIRLSTANVERLIAEKRLDEVAVQISICSPALRALERFAPSPEAGAQVKAKAAQALNSVIAVASYGLQGNQSGAEEAFKILRQQLQAAGEHFDPKTVAADAFFCPMHPDIMSENKSDACPKCEMTLVARRVPYSFIYTKPGEPTIRMTAEADGPIVAGRKTEVKVRLMRPGKGNPERPPLPSWMCGGGVGPVGPEELMVMHTQPLHLLIEEPGLSDYNHEHPVPTGVPGEYVFSFTPEKTAPYRVWADIVPMATGIQELPFADLPSAGTPAGISDRTPSFTSTVDGFTFTLALSNGASQPVANQTSRLAITITDREGKPVTRLEPVMQSFAHLVGFYEDYQTVVHIHPTGGDILREDLRGGPALGFKFFPPKPGFVRLYCQVKVDGTMLFASLGVSVLPQP